MCTFCTKAVCEDHLYFKERQMFIVMCEECRRERDSKKEHR